MLQVMIVDDERIIRQGLREMIDWQALGCELAYEAADGAEAWEILKNHPVDILVCDIQMPEMDGLTLVKMMNKAGLKTQTIMLTAYPYFEYAQKAVRYHAVDYLIKADYIECMPEAVQRAIASMESKRQPTRALPSEQTQKHSPMVSRVHAYINDQYAEEPSLGEIAAQLHVNKGYLGGLYKKEVGNTFAFMLQLRRVEAAKELLHDPYMQVKEIAGRVGFDDPARFTKVFTYYTGMSPTAYRESLTHPQ